MAALFPGPGHSINGRTVQSLQGQGGWVAVIPFRVHHWPVRQEIFLIKVELRFGDFFFFSKCLNKEARLFIHLLMKMVLLRLSNSEVAQ